MTGVMFPPFVLPLTKALKPTLLPVLTGASLTNFGRATTGLSTTGGSSGLTCSGTANTTRTPGLVFNFVFPPRDVLAGIIPMTVYAYILSGAGSGGTIALAASVRRQLLDGTFDTELVTGAPTPATGQFGATAAGVVMSGALNNAVVFGVNSDGFDPGDRLMVDITATIASLTPAIAAVVTTVAFG